jgi:predicted CoA-binding protein
MPVEDDHTLRTILQTSRTIAVVGASTKPGRDSGRIAKFLLDKGYRVVPVNPMYQEVLGLPCYPDLRAVPLAIDLVDVFRRSDRVLPIVEDAVAIGARTVWMQFGVVNSEAASLAERAGLRVVMDRCIAIEYNQLIG